MCVKTKARKSVTISITIALILFTYSTWDEYQIRNKDSLRQVVIENVERFRNCRKPQNGYKVYQCPECGTKKYVPFTCKSRLCIQQERMQLIVSLIIENQNGRGANIEKVVSEAVKRGIDKEKLLSDIQHMKNRGEAYEPKTGEIRLSNLSN